MRIKKFNLPTFLENDSVPSICIYGAEPATPTILNILNKLHHDRIVVVCKSAITAAKYSGIKNVETIVGSTFSHIDRGWSSYSIDFEFACDEQIKTCIRKGLWVDYAAIEERNRIAFTLVIEDQLLTSTGSASITSILSESRTHGTRFIYTTNEPRMLKQHICKRYTKLLLVQPVYNGIVAENLKRWIAKDSDTDVVAMYKTVCDSKKHYLAICNGMVGKYVL